MGFVEDYKSWNKYEIRRYFYFDSLLWGFFWLYIVFVTKQAYGYFEQNNLSMGLGSIMGGLIVIVFWYIMRLYVRHYTQKRIDENA